MNIETVNINSLRPARWATTHLLRPDERLLIQSMSDWGWLQPLVVRAEDRTIIDGNLRWVIAKEERPVSAKVGEDVPVVWVSCDEVDAMVLHVRLNRARGMQVATKLSSLLKWVAASGKYDARAIKNMLVMTGEEYEVLAVPQAQVHQGALLLKGLGPRRGPEARGGHRRRDALREAG
jgi:ParB-like chromosome segregation protein Spo0J